MEVVTHTKDNDDGSETYFFSTKHSQNTNEEYVPCTFSDVDSKQEVIDKWYSGEATEIPNPDPKYQA